MPVHGELSLTRFVCLVQVEIHLLLLTFSSPQLPGVVDSWVGIGLVFQQPPRQEEMVLLSHVRFRLNIRKKILHGKDCHLSMSGRITAPGNVPKMCRCGA